MIKAKKREDGEIEMTNCIKDVKKHILRIKNYVEVIILQYSDNQFKSHFRMFPRTFEFILTLISKKLIREKPGCPTISPKKQLLIAIWKMSTPDSYRSICEKFNVGRATALKSVRRVINVLIELAPVFISWPNEEKAIEIQNGFFAASGFPKVIGAIDGTHINIPAPHKDPETYVNRKGHHSIHLQAICDHECHFIHCYVGNPGSVHDQRVFRLSEVSNYLNDPNKFPNDSHLIGDAAYAIHEHLLVPYRDNGHLSVKQKNFNFCHSSTRMAIERAFGLLKGRFRSLLTLLDMERLDIIPKMILTCCILHNICLLRNDNFNDIDLNNISHCELLINNMTRAEFLHGNHYIVNVE
ncbi:putative nuclease HARBI1 isoform X2 [Linepithema humile]|uniref:putative nuclease HARBI1 isoform X2 n=1 Tax=Linepithema humile TaxID=83485 RepID=UPI00351EFDBC